MFELKGMSLTGCYELVPQVRSDSRGRFVKTFHQTFFSDHGLRTDFSEHYYSVSEAGVLRGLHFQLPPADHAKLVYCVSGRVLDVIVDLRSDSPTFGQHVSVELDADRANLLYMASGFAHGFYTLTGLATMMYHVTSVYSPEHDAGVHWRSAGIEWPDDNPVVSERDAELPHLADFDSPFTVEGA